MKILLLGGTGAMGTHLKDILSSRGDDIYITSRKQRQDGQHIFYIKGNAHELSFLNYLVARQWDAIVDFMVYSTEEFRQRVGVLLQSTNQYFFISSSGCIRILSRRSRRVLPVCWMSAETKCSLGQMSIR